MSLRLTQVMVVLEGGLNGSQLTGKNGKEYSSHVPAMKFIG